MTMIERIAAAIQEAETHCCVESHYRDCAKAALECLLEPTEEMTIAAFGPIRDGGRNGPVTSDFLRQQAALSVFTAMIRSALDEKEADT